MSHKSAQGHEKEKYCNYSVFIKSFYDTNKILNIERRFLDNRWK